MAAAAVSGYLDGLQGAYVLGWAMSETDDRTCAISITNAAGKLVGTGKAALHRPDLAKCGLGRTNFGFRIPVKGLHRAGLLRVLADGVELVGSPAPVGSGQYDGALRAANGVVSGWLSERVGAARSHLVRLVDQEDTVLAEVLAEPDPSEADPLFVPARFKVALDQACFGRPDLRLRALVDGVRVAEAGCALRLDGYLDAITPERCAGWLLSPDAPGRTMRIAVYRSGVLVGTGPCDLPREDLKGRYPQSWRAGFEIALKAPDRGTFDSSEFSIRLVGSERELFDGPFVIETRVAALEAARRIGRLAYADERLAPADRSLLQGVLAEFIERRRHDDQHGRRPIVRRRIPAATERRLNIAIPIYRDVEVTRGCIASVLRARDAARDAVVLINDCSPEAGMDAMLERFAREPNVFLLTNPANLGFVRSANRGLAFCGRGDVLLLNSDTQVFGDAFDEMWRVAHAAPDIGTVTALSNNATIFSYPHPGLRCAALADAAWADVAALARQANAGLALDVPTGHAFCMLIKREVLERVGLLDEAFGRGYGEENDFCQRAADLGYRQVAAAGVFVEHREKVSFAAEKEALLEANLARLGRMYPEYSAAITEFERAEGLRRARWSLDAGRLRRASAAGAEFALVVTNWLGGGTRKAAGDIEAATGYGRARKLGLACREDGLIELQAEEPALRAVFAADEMDALFELLAAANVTLAIIHQLLGFPVEFVSRLAGWAEGRNIVFFAHDYYPICPRVTMIDAAGEFCDIAAPEVCARCLAGGGAHEGSRMDALSPAEHRAAFARLLGAARHVVAPSRSAAGYLERAWPGLKVTVSPHPEPDRGYPAQSRAGLGSEVVLLGGIGPHKGSAKLLEIARRARLTHPELRFRVIGSTDIDAELRALANVTVTGGYEPRELPGLVAQAEGRLALFLHGWPETYSYTLSEAVAFGFFPLVPDIGAPAERVRAAGFGAVFPFPIEAAEVLRVIGEAMAGEGKAATPDATRRFQTGHTAALHELFGSSRGTSRQSTSRRRVATSVRAG